MYTTTEGARDNLIREGHPPWTIKTVGNVMADTLKRFLPRALEKYPNKRTGSYAMFTLHRAENVDNKTKMQEIIDAISEVSKTIPVIFPKHPRRHVSLYVGGISVVEPMSYLEFIATMARCNFIMTDSGGVQEESTILGIPCITIRENTERPETVHQGTNRIAGTDGGSILELAKDAELRRASTKVFPVPDLWEGKAAERLLKDLSERM
jgi:UDP-N-acetylglucosamine 2-epimerase (non-hydrolysing)